MKHVQLFEKFSKINSLFSGKSILLESLLTESNIYFKINEASKADFKPSKTMVAHAIGGKSTNANSAVKFATAVAQQWDDLEDEQKSGAKEKWEGLKGKFKKQVAALRAKADGGDNRSKGELDDVAYSSRKEVPDLMSSKIDPLYADSGEKSAKADPDKIKAEIEKLKTEIEKVKSDIEKQIEIRNEAGFSSDEGKAAQKKIMDLSNKEDELEKKIDSLEGKLDDGE